MQKLGRKILILGLDGMTFDLIHPLIEKKRLPAISRMMEDGTQARLKSTVMPNSFPAWVSLTTGVNPGKHGIFWSLIRPDSQSSSLKLMSSHDIGVKRIWHYLGEHGCSVGVFNMPTEYPPTPVHGFLVCGALTPDPSCPFTFPETLKDEILRIVPDYRCEIDYALVNLDHLAGQVFHSISNREKILLHLLKNKPWDFFMGVFTETDLVQHKYWAGIDDRHPRHKEFKKKFGTFVCDVYIRLDEALGKILDIIPEETMVFVVSDHGFGPFYQSFSLPVWLKENGYLSLNEGTLSSLVKKILKKFRLWKNAQEMRNRLLSFRLGLQGKRNVRHLREKDAVASREHLNRINWDGTRAYFAPDYGIRLNLKERDPLGIVQPGPEEHLLKDEIKRKLLNIFYSNGEPVFEAVMTKEEAYSGPFLGRAPDLVVPVNYAAAPPLPEPWPYALTHPSLTGTHTPYGILLAKGPGIRKNCSLEKAQVMDIAPTILNILQLSIPQDMDGQVLQGLFEQELQVNGKISKETSFLRQVPPTEIQELSPEEAKKIEQRLRDLGYID